jgi:chromosomal replication initiation ATPase DnaA
MNLARRMSIQNPDITSVSIYSLLCDFCAKNGCTISELKSKNRSAYIVNYRVGFAKMAYKYFSFNTIEIGEALNRDASTINHYINNYVEKTD